MAENKEKRYPNVLGMLKDYPWIVLLFNKILRFKGYEHIYKESLKTHVQNCELRLRGLVLNEKSYEMVKRILQVHDLAEVITDDKLAHHKTKNDSEEELLSVEKLDVSLEDRDLIYKFFEAKKLLNGFGVNNEPEEGVSEAVLAKIIDFWDSAESFHFHLPVWIDSQKYEKHKMPEVRALVYAFNICELYLKNLEKIQMDEELRTLSKNILLSLLDWMKAHWQQIPQDRVPWQVKRKVRWAEKVLEGIDINTITEEFGINYQLVEFGGPAVF